MKANIFFCLVVLLLVGVVAPATGQWVKHIIDDNLDQVGEVAVGDMDGDTDLDVVAAGQYDDDVVLYEYDGPSWTKHVIDDNLYRANDVSVGDMDGDTDLDVVAAGTGVVVWYEAPSWTKHVIDGYLPGPCFVCLADMDDDTDLDVIATGSGEGDVVWYEAPGGNQRPTAFIDAIIPNLTDQGQQVCFLGHGTDADGTIIGYYWRSSIAESLSTDSSFCISALPAGFHTIYFKVQDDGDRWSYETTDYLVINNMPPNTPAKPSGPTSVYPDTLYSYSTNTTDPGNDSVYYLFDWGDEIDSLWRGPFNSGDSCIASHAWAELDTYYVKVKAKDIWDEESDWSDSLSIPVGIEEEQLSFLSREFTLVQNYPNPFNPITQIRYALPRDCHVRLEVYNLLGQKVVTLIDGKQKAGYKTARWNASSLSSGIYFYRLQAGDFVKTRKMVLLK